MKFYISLVFCLILSNTYAQTNLNDGLVGCYPFSGNASDLSDRANHGTVSGAKMATDRFGNANSAYDFDGIDDYIEINPNNLKTNQFSYSFWVYPRSFPGRDQAFFMISVGSASGDQGVLIGDDYTGVLTGFSNGSYIGYDYNVRCMTGVMPRLNQWYHVVLMKDVDNYYFYVDGKLICANPINGSAAYFGTGPVKATFGARFNYGQAIDAIIDDIHLYDRPLNNAEIEMLYNAKASTTPEQVTLTQDNLTSCAGEQVKFTASPSSPATSHIWKVDGIAQPLASGNEFTYQLPDRNADYQAIISVEIPYINPCGKEETVEAEKTIFVTRCEPSTEEPKLHIPTAFTPNNDGRNDSWQILNADTYPELKIRIFNRWGQVIFQSVGYDTPWNGTYKGIVVPAGVYPYKIFSQQNLIEQGAVTVVH